MEGIKVGDIGAKIGYNNMDNGYCFFDKVKIPRRNMAMRYSSVDKNGSLRPFYKSINSFALVENGVCTSVNLPSLLFHNFGSLIARKKFEIFSDLFLSLAVIFNLSICYRILVSFFELGFDTLVHFFLFLLTI